ncbi:MAG: hypothetical protein ACE5GI_07955 [Candidatus Aminicenantales bacterium]
MNFKKLSFKRFLSTGAIIFLCFPSLLSGYEIFIYRPHPLKNFLSREHKVSLHGDLFAYFQYPCNFPSYNDLSGAEDRWLFGFQNYIFISPKAFFLAQLVTHDDGQRRTKFDWHFSFRYSLFENLRLILGHDSNHDSDYQSHLNNRPYFLNRNYIGFGLPFKIGSFYLEPFTWFFHHSNQRGHLDLSGNKLRQEMGLRLGYWNREGLSLSLQVLSQTEKLFSLGQAYLADLILMIKTFDWLEISLGAGLWADLQPSRWGGKQKFFKIIWGVAIPF